MGEPPCSQVLLTVCRKRSRSSPHQRGNTPSGSEDPSWLPCPPSNRCGSPSRNTTNLAQPSSTENASKSLATQGLKAYSSRCTQNLTEQTLVKPTKPPGIIVNYSVLVFVNTISKALRLSYTYIRLGILL